MRGRVRPRAATGGAALPPPGRGFRRGCCFVGGGFALVSSSGGCCAPSAAAPVLVAGFWSWPPPGSAAGAPGWLPVALAAKLGHSRPGGSRTSRIRSKRPRFAGRSRTGHARRQPAPPPNRAAYSPDQRKAEQKPKTATAYAVFSFSVTIARKSPSPPIPWRSFPPPPPPDLTTATSRGTLPGRGVRVKGSQGESRREEEEPQRPEDRVQNSTITVIT